jgi:long-chain acyl-CoA synthetase
MRPRRHGFVLENAEIDFAVVEDQEQVDKMLELKQSYAAHAHIAYDDERGMRHYRSRSCFPSRAAGAGPRL